jgi:hypothetical protein
VSARDGSSAMMRTPGLDLDTADRLLAGRVAPDDAPPGYADLARLVSAVIGPPTPGELSRLDEDVDAAAAVRARAGTSTSARRKPSRSRSRSGGVRTVVLVAVGSIAATSGLAAAGVLPDPLQDVVSDALSRVGITVPSGDGDREGGNPPAGSGSRVSPVAVLEEPTLDTPAQIPTTPRERAGTTDEHGPGNGPRNETPGNGPPEHAGSGPPSDTPGNGPPEHAGSGPPSDTPGNGPPEHAGSGPPSDTPGNGPPEHAGSGPPSDTPGNGPPEHAGSGPPDDTPGQGPPAVTPGNGPPDDTPGQGPPADTPGNGPPADPGGGQGKPPPGQGNGPRPS